MRLRVRIAVVLCVAWSKLLDRIVGPYAHEFQVAMAMLTAVKFSASANPAAEMDLDSQLKQRNQ